MSLADVHDVWNADAFMKQGLLGQEFISNFLFISDFIRFGTRDMLKGDW